MKCELMVQSLGEKKENYNKSVVEVTHNLKLIVLQTFSRKGI